MAVVVEFWDGKIASEHIYWDQATVLVQAGLIDGEGNCPLAAPKAPERYWTPLPCPPTV